MSELLDATDVVAENARRARSFGRRLLWLVVSAKNCDGCDRLARQLAEPEVRDRLAGDAYLVKLEAGDLRGAVASKVKIGDWTLESPGFPTSWLWTVSDDGLTLSAVCVGPLDELRPDVDLDALLDGRSSVVPEARGVTLQACSGGICLPLNAANDFSTELTVAL